MEFSETLLDGIDDDPTPGDIRRWIGQAKAGGGTAERTRIRRELLESFILAFGDDAHETRHLIEALRRICPEEG